MTEEGCPITSLAALVVRDSSGMDSAFENTVVGRLVGLDAGEKWKFLEVLLTHSHAKVRALGLRVVRRAIREQEILDKVVRLCFEIDRFSALQKWYLAILSRYSTRRFGRMLCAEIKRRADAQFAIKHIRALEMYRSKGNKAKKEVLERVKKITVEQGLIWTPRATDAL